MLRHTLQPITYLPFRSSLCRLAVGVGAVFATVSFGGAARAATVPDAWITLHTKIALVTEDHLPAAGVHVDTRDGRITLSGKVSNEAQKRQAGVVAKGMNGSTGVRNLLQVVAAANAVAVGEADDRIKAQVESALKADSSLAGSDISVKSVNDGAVLLSGTAKSLYAHWSAVETADSVAGVRGVATEIKATDDAPGAEVAQLATDAKSTAHDSWTTAAVKLRLFADGDVPALDVGVDTSHGVVSLFGEVPSMAARASAIADARKVDSVVGVNDDLHVVRARSHRWVATDNDVAKHNVETALAACPDLGHVSVEVNDGKAHLTGSVASDWDRLRAASAARGAKGVRSVDDELHIEQPRG